MDSAYDDDATVKDFVLRGRHRDFVGGLWDEVGRLQRDFLIAQGMLPGHVLLDIGCGAFRGGVQLIPYLDPGNYWGIDKSALLLKVGWALELERAGLTARQPRAQLVCLDDFQFAELGVCFDYAIAQSLFTHLSLNRIRRCLARLAPRLHHGGHLYASFFEVGEGEDREASRVHTPGCMTSHSDRSFYHYSRRDFTFAAADLPFRIDYIGDWGHPRGQQMLAFVKQ